MASTSKKKQIEYDVVREVTIEINPKIVLNGNLRIPKDAKGIVVFAHGSGSSRFRFASYLRIEEYIILLLYNLCFLLHPTFNFIATIAQEIVL